MTCHVCRDHYHPDAEAGNRHCDDDRNVETEESK